MNATEMDIPYATHWRMARPAENFEVSVTADGEVELAALFLPDSNVSLPRTPEASSVTIHMDHLVASNLLLSLHDKLQAKHWMLPEEGECQI